MTSDGQAAVRASTSVADDAEARRLAVESNASVLVRAPAGSGKTELLVRRFLRLLATVEEPEQIVALTFSRKAAAEMHQRLLEALAGARRTEPGNPYERRRWELARAALEQDARRGWRLEQTPRRLRVLTLDALAMQLVNRMPWTARASSALQPAEEAGALYRAATRATLAGALQGGGTASAAARALLGIMDAKVESAERLLGAMLEGRDQWLGLLGAGHGAAELDTLRKRIEADLAAVVEEELAALRAQIGDLGGPELPATNGLKPWRECADRLVTKAGTPRKRIEGGGAPISPEAAAVLHRVRTLPEPALTAAQWDGVASALALLPRAAAALQAEFQANGSCDFIETTLAAVAALGSSDDPSALAFALDGQLRHLFLDEFQDTSHAQFALLDALVREWSPGDGRSLFLVGDPMQSIYGWRNAEPGLMLATLRQARFGPLPLTCLQLTANYRSGEALVAWNNAIYSQVAVPADDAALGAARFAPALAAAAEAEPPALHVLPAFGAEAERVAGIVQQELAERGEDADVAVLVQSRSGTEAIMAALQRRGIHPAGIKLWPLLHPAATRDLWALARALRHGADRIAWLAVLRAPWCGLTLADLHALCGGDAGTAATLIEERLRDRTATGGLSADGHARLARVAAPLLAAAAQRGRTHFASLTAWCWRALGGEALAGEHRAAALELLALMEQAPDTWEDRLARSYAPPDAGADHRVKLMTVHQAKGLQFDCVILPGLGRRPRAGDPAMLRYRLEPAQHDAGERFLMAAHPGVALKDPLYDFLDDRECRRREQEQLRLMYVGCTRAQRRLHLVTHFDLNDQGAVKTPDRRTALARLWPALENEIRAGAGTTAPPGTALPAATPPPLCRVPEGWQPARRGDVAWGAPAAAPPPSAADPVGLATASADFERRVGIAVHGMLQEIAEGGELRWRPERLRLQLRRAGVTAAGLEAAERSAREALAATLADPQGQWILGPRADAHCEWALAGWAGGGPRQAIVDRTFIENGTRWIVDYKTTAERGGDREAFLASQAELHRGQLALYAELARGLGPEPVRCGLYFARLGAWREVEC